MKKLIFLTFVMFLLMATTSLADETVVGVAPGGNSRPDNSELNELLREDLQDYVWEKCENKYKSYNDCLEYYVFAIAVMDFESDFEITAKSGTDDYGIMQVNSCNWKSLKKKLGLDGNIAQLRGDAKMAIDCGFEILNECVDSAGGVCELAYRKYNGGVDRKKTNGTSHLFANGDWSKWKKSFGLSE